MKCPNGYIVVWVLPIITYYTYIYYGIVNILAPSHYRRWGDCFLLAERKKKDRWQLHAGRTPPTKTALLACQRAARRRSGDTALASKWLTLRSTAARTATTINRYKLCDYGGSKHFWKKMIFTDIQSGMS